MKKLKEDCTCTKSGFNKIIVKLIKAGINAVPYLDA